MIQGHHYLWIMEYDVDLNEIMQQWQSTAFHVKCIQIIQNKYNMKGRGHEMDIV